MSMMSEIHAAMTRSGEIARVEELQREVAELEVKIAAETAPEWRAMFRRRRRLLSQDVDRIMGAYALQIARA